MEFDNGADNLSYKYALQLSTLRSKLISIKKEVEELNRQQKLQFINEKLRRLQEVYETVIKFMENIDEKKTQTMMKMQELSTTDASTLPLPWTCYEDVLNLVADIKKLKTVLEDPTVYTDDTEDELNDYLGKLQKAVYVLNRQVVECDELLQKSKKFVKNMATLSAESDDEDKTDLGCYPHEKSVAGEDCSFTNISNISVEFTTDLEPAQELGETVKVMDI